ncbi:MAG: sigma-70 family RNA polymerase sigma factor [Chitinophagaceae bacterium]|nr:sigma-70 family RNA polymerase sigma factor [Chitinophagaceae bacterium]MDP1765101.1 sigma-70 family RNA polymerase sigma factor [Sediminibacterium sp.]
MLYFQAVSKQRYDHITDSELLDKFYSDKDTQWLGILLQRYTFLLLGVCMKYLKNEEAAKDAVQQIFLKTIVELGKYKVTYLKSWLYMVAKNHCLMNLRDRHIFIPVEGRTEIIATETGPEERINKETTLTILEKALSELNREQKTCVTLFYLQKKSYQDIVDTTGYTLLQVKSFIQNGKRNLKLLVEKKMKATE